MTEVRDLAAKIFGRTLGRAIYALILKTAVDFNAEAQRRKVTQRKSEVI